MTSADIAIQDVFTMRSGSLSVPARIRICGHRLVKRRVPTVRKTALFSAALASLAALAPLQAQHLNVKPAGRHWQAVILPSADTLRFTIWVPQGLGTSNGAAKVPLLLATHFGGRVTPYMGGAYMDMLVVQALADLGAVIVAPDAHSTTGWSPDDEQRLIWLVKEMMRIYPIDPAKVAMTGFSAGGRQAWYIANRNQDLFTAVIPVAAPIRELPPNPWKIPAFVVHSTADERVVVGPVKEYVAAQRAAGAPMEIHLVDGISHNRTSDFAEALSHAIPWLERVW